ncbi:MAG: YqeG family HAD IIIA-type phosphatase [Peptococcaceae bacterium]|jgi:HAD superfamily phosphatase (TIGR01668 family)|nr:YqeG family HAD IIIA-type phosphatase [Peptococcaceae bacterium]
MKLLRADANVDRLSEIDVGAWYAKGIRCILMDLDNTIALWKSTALTEDAIHLIAEARSTGIAVVLFTNAHEARAREAAWNAGVSYYALARKPFPFKYNKAFAELDLHSEEVMAIGDQVFTDVLGGNLTGCITVLTTPLSESEFSGTKMLRLFERLFAGRKTVYLDRP